MMGLRRAGVAILAAIGLAGSAATGAVSAKQPAPLVAFAQTRGGFVLAGKDAAAPILISATDAKVVAHAAGDLADDIALVTGTRPAIVTDAAPARTAVIVGTLGANPLIDRLAASGKIDASRLKGGWESHVIATVERPLPSIDRALVIAGSDRRGTAYGIYALSEAIGVSPWLWWADVRPERRTMLTVPAGTVRFGSPSVRYRGIFINDEDWGLVPWAARTFDPERGNLGPKTYEKIFQLLLRLKANTLWPAMHKSSTPFNADPANAKLADDYAIVMGSSHAEPMLRNNVGEWKDDPDRFNYAVNRAGVKAYWERRVASNAGYESLWTIGMRGIHDSGIVGADTREGKIAILNDVIADQRAMLEAHLGKKAGDVPQMFMPYKEVLDLYRGGLKVPDDVTIVWPDDNFGYIRQFPNAVERARAGGSGVYYHLSYLGAPLSYLWLSTTPPALVLEEMTRAWDAGARQLWVVNVGDIKPAEIDISLFFEMAWDVEIWRNRGQADFLKDWAGRTFGADKAEAVGSVLDRHFALGAERRPEHLQAFLPGERPHLGLFTPAEGAVRRARYMALERDLDALAGTVSVGQRDAFFELVDYPVRAAAQANRRFLASELYARTIDTKPDVARLAAGEAYRADVAVKALTRRFNEEVAIGKWRHLIAEEPADNQWPMFRTPPLALPVMGQDDGGAGQGPPPPSAPDLCGRAPVMRLVREKGWRTPPGLGLSGAARLAVDAGAEAVFDVETVEGCGLALALLPTFPTEGQTGFDIDVSVDGLALSPLHVEREAGTRDWSLGVLANRLLAPLPPLGPGHHRLALRARQSGLVLDTLLLTPPANAAAAH